MHLVVTDDVLMPKVKASAQKKVAQVKAIKKPVLVLGWGREGSKDVHRIADTFRHDSSIDCVASQLANSREALGEHCLGRLQVLTCCRGLERT